MTGTINILTQGGRKASIEIPVQENRRISQEVISEHRQKIVSDLHLNGELETPYWLFLLLPSKMNYDEFV